MNDDDAAISSIVVDMTKKGTHPSGSTPRPAPRSQPVLNMKLPPDVADALERFIQDQRVSPDKTTVGLTALREFFEREGYLPTVGKD